MRSPQLLSEESCILNYMSGLQFNVEFIREKTIAVDSSQTLLEASLAAGIPHYHACGGNARCSTCRVLILEGSAYLNKRNKKEELLVAKMKLPSSIRLACQARVNGGPVKLQRIIRDESDIGLYKDLANEEIGEEKHLVLMFLDIREFTPFSATYLPFDVIHVLKKMFFLFGLNINMHGGQIIDTAGDGLYAVFGMKGSVEEAAMSAIAAAEGIINDVSEFNENYLQVHFQHRLDVGIGVHTGNVIVGNLKIDNASHTTVMGYPVNVAARIQAATRSLNNNFLVSEQLAKLLPTFRSETPPSVINAKGVKDKIKVYTLGTSYND